MVSLSQKCKVRVRLPANPVGLTSAVLLPILLAACGEPDDGTAASSARVESGASAMARGESDTLPYYDSADMTPLWYPASAPQLRQLHAIPAFSFTNQNGQTITNDTYENKIYVVSFFFATCPGICSTVNLRLRHIQDEFLDDDKVRILSHSITPEADTVEELDAYADKNEIQSGKWDLVTGDRNEIYSIARQGYFADEDLGKAGNNGDFLHTDNILLIDQNRRIRGVYSGMSSYAMFNLIDDIKILEKELSTL